MSKEQENKLLRYLEKFNYADLPDEFIISSGGSVKSKAETSKIKVREKRVAALKRFQKFSALPATGRINKLTLKQMEVPHCSFPDITTNELMLFSLAPPRWNTRKIRYNILRFTQQLPKLKVRQAIQNAFSIWSSHAFPFEFREVDIDDNPMIIIKFVTGKHNDDSPFEGVDGDLAHAFPPNYNVAGLAGDIHFDDAEGWGVPGLPSKYDLLTVAIHEIGHALGLGHSPNKSSIMYGDYQKVSHNLDNETIANIRNLYQGI